MRISQNFIIRQIADEFMLVPIGPSAAQFNGLISTNEIGHFIIQNMKNDISEDELLNKIQNEYSVDRKTAQIDLHDFLKQLRELNALAED